MKDAWPPAPPQNPEPSFEIPLGPFILHDIIGKGGMGEVWRGVHAKEGVEVAVKVITSRYARTPRFVSSFRREVQTIAGLNHPGIVMVLDVGEVPREAERLSEGRIKSGCPYLAMERAEGGGLGAEMWSRRMGWREIKGVLLDLLDALAHAHARGVVHLDFKPDNILWVADDEGGGRWKLSDFGIAHVIDRNAETQKGQSIGTPSFMAPEQILGLFRDYGPWTDLYALGCTTYKMVSGEVPFTVKDLKELANLHLHVDPPPLAPRCVVPEGFEGWARRLLQKSPRQRFLRAADAAWALERLGDPPELEEEEAAPHEATALFSVARLAQGSAHERAAVAERRAEFTDPTQVSAPRDAIPTSELSAGGFGSITPETVVRRAPSMPLPMPPPTPPTWRRPSTSAPPALVGAGLGLFGLRSVPMVDREPERDRLWEALQSVEEERQARLLVLYGEAGCGKSRLAEWVCERAHEVGAAIVMRATHGPDAGPQSGVTRMIARHLRCVGVVEYTEVLERTERRLRGQGVSEEWEWEALASAIADAVGVELPGWAAALENPSERHSLLRRLVGRTARDRPVVLWLDDAQYSLDTLSFAEGLIDTQTTPRQPLLVMVTVQAESLAERPRAQGMLERVLSHPRAERLDLEPLGREHVRGLVEGLLGLEEALVDRVVARAGGNPLFAVQIVGEWVQQGLLEVGQSGFRLQSGATLTAPRDLHHIWAERLGGVLAGRPAQDQAALELAALLGQEVEAHEWQEACVDAGLAPSPDLIHVMVDQGLMQWREGGFAFAHGMLRESAVRLSEEAGRRPTLHRACVEMLQRLGEAHGARGLAERVARHLVAAGSRAAAVDPLLQAAQERVDAGELSAAEELLGERDAVMRAVGLGGEDARWGRGQVLWADLLRKQGRYQEGLDQAGLAEQQSHDHTLPHLLAESVKAQAQITYEMGHHDRARTLYTRAESLFSGLEDASGEADCEEGLGDIHHVLGELDEALACFERVLSHRREAEDAHGVSKVLYGLACVQHTRGELQEAQELFEASLERAEEVGHTSVVLNCLNGIGEIERDRGLLDAAERSYRRVYSLYESMGSANVIIASINIALVLLLRGRYSEARPLLLDAAARAEQDGRDALLGGLHAELLPCAAAAEDWAAWDHHHKQASILLSTSGVADPDDAWPAQLGGDLAAERGQIRRARGAYALARRLWIRLGRDDEVEEVEAAVKALEARG